jgi:hypothetical protein
MPRASLPGSRKAPRKIFYPLPPETEALYDRRCRPARAGPAKLHLQPLPRHPVPPSRKRRRYANADLISDQLATIMRVLLVKRLDSSFHAFRQSLNRFRDATRVMVDMFEKGTIYIAPNLRVNEFHLDGREAELLAN